MPGIKESGLDPKLPPPDPDPKEPGPAPCRGRSLRIPAQTLSIRIRSRCRLESFREKPCRGNFHSHKNPPKVRALE